jgi:hypothetical protein
MNKVTHCFSGRILASVTLVVLLTFSTVGQAGPSVTVVNPPADPVQSRDVDNPARQPFQKIVGAPIRAIALMKAFVATQVGRLLR